MRIAGDPARRFGSLALSAVLAVAAMTVLPAGSASAAVPSATAAAPSVDACRAPAMGSDIREGFPLASNALPSRGTPVVQTLYVDFDDAPGDPREIVGMEANLDLSVDAVRQQSAGELRMQRRSYPTWTRLVGASAGYEDGDRLLAAAVAATDGAVDFSAVDVVWVVWTTQTPHDGFRSQAWNTANVVADGRTLTHGVLLRQLDITLTGQWVAAHETGHTLGLPDLYDTRPAEGPTTRWSGPWDLMGSTDGPGRAYVAWHRWMLTWAADRQVTCIAPGNAATVALSPVQSDGPTLLAAVRLDGSRVLAVESRRAEGLDLPIPREGVLVYTVDVTHGTGAGPIKVEFPDGRVPAVRDSTTLVDAPLQSGETYTDAATGVTVHVESTGGSADVVRVDASSIPPMAVTAKKTIAYYQTTREGGELVSPLGLVTHDTGVDAVAFGVFDVKADGLFVRNGEPFFADTDQDARAELSRVRRAGVPVIATVGGESATLWSLLAQDFTRYYENLRDYLLLYGFDGVELDIRTAASTDTVVRLLDGLRRDLGPRTVISFAGAPSAFDDAAGGSPGYRAVYAARAGDIAWFSVRLPCDAAPPTPTDYLRIVNDTGIPPEKLVLAAPTRPGLCAGDASWVSPATLARQLQGIVAVEPRFGGVAGWEYAGALPGGAAEPWRWYALMSRAMAEPLPLPTPEPSESPGAGGRGELARSGANAPIGLIPVAGAAVLIGLLMVRRPRSGS